MVSFHAPQSGSDSAPSLLMKESSHQAGLRNPEHCIFTLQLTQNTSSVLEKMACGYGQILLERIAVDGSHVPSLEDQGPVIVECDLG